MTLVVDASVALKWVLLEQDRDRAIALLTEDELIAPDLLHVECANALTMRVRRGLISAVNASDALHVVLNAPVLIRSSASLVAKAHDLSLELQRTAYDSLYLALAVAEDAVLVTADGKFADAVEKTEPYRASVRRL